MPAVPLRSVPLGSCETSLARTETAASRAAAEFEALYDEHFAFVWRSLRRLGVNEAYLDDATQDVFIVALRRKTEFRGQSSYRTWLFGITANVAREVRRKSERRSRHDPLDVNLEAREPTPHDRLNQVEAARLLDAFLASLDEPKREIFVMTELEQMPAPEISAVLGVKLNTVYSRLRAAREAFLRYVRLHGEALP